MKRKLLTVAAIASSLSMFAQGVQDSISVGLSYSNRSYYSLSNGEAANVPNNGWDLAFDLGAFGSSIRSNGQAGVNVYLYPNGDASAWSTADTAGHANWKVLHNSEESWDIGAFDKGIVLSNPFDLGWGVYNQFNHTVYGDSIYFVETPSGAWKKLLIESMSTTTFTFKYANADGTNEVSEVFQKATYPGKRFVYYSLTGETLLDLEPVMSAWDIMFTKYIAELAPDVYYPVTGVLNNKHVRVAKADDLADPYAATNYQGFAFDSVANAIGYDWKSFNMGTFQYDLADSTAYFLKDTSGAVHRIIFTKFEGASTGKIGFHKQDVNTVGFGEEPSKNSFSVYPNPSSGLVQIAYELEQDGFVSILNMNGQLVKQSSLGGNAFLVKTIDLQNLPKGMYLVQITSGNESVTQQLIIE